MTILQIVQDVCVECGIAPPSLAVASPDTTIQQMVLFAMRSGNDLQRRWTWKAQKKQNPATFTGDGTTTLFTLPADFGSLQPSDTFTSSVYPTIPLRGPINEDTLLRLKQWPVVATPAFWRPVYANSIEFYPAPALGEIISYVYASRPWILAADGTTYRTRWADDTDTSIISEDLITLHTVWRWKKAKGLDYSEEMRTAEASFDIEAAAEDTERTINMSGACFDDDNWWPGAIVVGGSGGGNTPTGSMTKRQIVAALADATNPSGMNMLPTIQNAVDPLGGNDASVEWIAGSSAVSGDPLCVLIQSTAGWTAGQMATFQALALSKPA